jgi:phosphate transport system protein
MLHFQQQLEELQQRLLAMARLVEAAIDGSIRAVTERNREEAEQVLRNEALVNQCEIDIDDQASRLLALHHPMARDLRFVIAAIKINTDLERMGDLAVNIAERAITLAQRLPVDTGPHIPQMTELTKSMVNKSLAAFVDRDANLARSVLVSDDAVDNLKEAVYREETRTMESGVSTIPSSVDLMFIAHNLERIADHSTNIAEDVLFLLEGIDVRHHSEAGSRRE